MRGQKTLIIDEYGKLLRGSLILMQLMQPKPFKYYRIHSCGTQEFGKDGFSTFGKVIQLKNSFLGMFFQNINLYILICIYQFIYISKYINKYINWYICKALYLVDLDANIFVKFFKYIFQNLLNIFEVVCHLHLILFSFVHNNFSKPIQLAEEANTFPFTTGTINLLNYQY